jgi:hypothetical protein
MTTDERSDVDETPAEDVETDEYLDRLCDLANEKHGSNAIEIEQLTIDDISEADGGVWVRGWLWLADKDLGDLRDTSDDDDDNNTPED